MTTGIEVSLIGLVIAAGWSDLRTRQIPNWITVPGAILGLVLQAIHGGLVGGLASIEGAVLGLGMFVVFYIAGGMGAGDVKLLGAVGALVGPESLVLVFVLTGVLGGVAAVGAMIRKTQTIPYGAVIAAGTLMSLIVIQ